MKKYEHVRPGTLWVTKFLIHGGYDDKPKFVLVVDVDKKMWATYYMWHDLIGGCRWHKHVLSLKSFTDLYSPIDDECHGW